MAVVCKADFVITTNLNPWCKFNRLLYYVIICLKNFSKDERKGDFTYY